MTTGPKNTATVGDATGESSDGLGNPEPPLRRDATIRELAMIIIGLSEGPIFIDEIADRILQVRPDLKPASIRSEISMLAAMDGTSVERVRRGWYNKAGVPLADDEWAKMISIPLKELIDAAEGHIEEPPGYNSSALALVDAVFSARSRYNSVLNVVRNIKAATGWGDVEEFTIDELLKFIWEKLGWKDVVGISAEERLKLVSKKLRDQDEASHRGEVLRELFGNVAVAARTGMTKSELVIEFGLRMQNVTALKGDLNITLNSKADFRALTRGPLEEQVDLLEVIEAALVDPQDGVRGIGPATVRYLYLLMGIDVVKPDRMLIRWVQGALGGKNAPPDPYRTAQLIEGAARIVQSEGCPWSIRAIDRLIWKVQSGRIPELADYQRGPAVESGVATRQANSVNETSEFHEGMQVDWSPRNPHGNQTEKWHGRITDIPRAGRVEVEWTKSDSPREFRPGTKIPLRIPRDISAEILPYRERVSASDLVRCDHRQDHPNQPRIPTFQIDDKVERIEKRADGAKWKGSIVGTVGTRGDRFIVHWTEITRRSGSIDEKWIDDLFRVELARNIESVNPWSEIDWRGHRRTGPI